MQIRAVLGVIAGAIMLLSCFAHALGGWSHMAGRLSSLQAPVDLILALKLGWMLGSVCMLAFAVIAIGLCLQRLRGRQVASLPLAAIAIAYTGYGGWALLITQYQLGFLIFLVPGILLLIAAPGKISAAGR